MKNTKTFEEVLANVNAVMANLDSSKEFQLLLDEAMYHGENGDQIGWADAMGKVMSMLTTSES